MIITTRETIAKNFLTHSTFLFFEREESSYPIIEYCMYCYASIIGKEEYLFLKDPIFQISYFDKKCFYKKNSFKSCA